VNNGQVTSGIQLSATATATSYLTVYYEIPSTFVLQLGDREINGILPYGSTGIVVIQCHGILLTRTDRRILTSPVAGDWTLELCGHADSRY
jgi:hypothetical protein